MALKFRFETKFGMPRSREIPLLQFSSVIPSLTNNEKHNGVQKKKTAFRITAWRRDTHILFPIVAFEYHNAPTSVADGEVIAAFLERNGGYDVV